MLPLLKFFISFLLLVTVADAGTAKAQIAAAPSFDIEKMEVHVSLPVSYDPVARQIETDVVIKNSSSISINNVSVVSDLMSEIAAPSLQISSATSKVGAPVTSVLVNTVTEVGAFNLTPNQSHSLRLKRPLLNVITSPGYSMRVSVVSSNGSPLGSQTFSLPGFMENHQGILIKPGSFFLTDPAGKTLSIYPRIELPTSALISLAIINSGSQVDDLTPVVKANRNNPYSANALSSERNHPVHLLPGESKVLSLSLPKALPAGNYAVSVSFLHSDSDTEILRSPTSPVLLAGESADIQKSAPIASNSLFKGGNIDSRTLLSFPDLSEPTWSGKLFIRVENSATHEIVSSSIQPFTRNSGQRDIDLNVNNRLTGLKYSGFTSTVLIEVQDSKGKTLDSYSEPLQIPPASIDNAAKLALGTLVLLLVGTFSVLIYLRNRKINAIKIAAGSVILMVVLGIFPHTGPVHAANLNTFSYTTDQTDSSYYDFFNQFVRSNMGVGYSTNIYTSNGSYDDQYQTSGTASSPLNFKDGVAVAQYSFALGWGADWSYKHTENAWHIDPITLYYSSTTTYDDDYLDLQYPIPELGIPCRLNGQDVESNDGSNSTTGNRINKGASPICTNNWAWKNYFLPSLSPSLYGDLMDCNLNSAFNSKGGKSAIGNQTYSYGTWGSQTSYASSPVYTPLNNGSGVTEGYLVTDAMRNGTLNVWVAACVGSNAGNPTMGKADISLSMGAIDNKFTGGHGDGAGAGHAMDLVKTWSSGAINLGYDATNGGNCDDQNMWCPADTGGNSLIKPYEAQIRTLPTWYPANPVNTQDNWDVNTFKDEIKSCQQFSFSNTSVPGSDAQQSGPTPAFTTQIFTQNGKPSFISGFDAPIPSYPRETAGRGHSLHNFDARSRSISCPPITYPVVSSFADIIFAAPSSIASGSPAALSWTDGPGTAYVMLSGGEFNGSAVHYPANSGLSTQSLIATTSYTATPYTAKDVAGPPSTKQVTVTNVNPTAVLDVVPVNYTQVLGSSFGLTLKAKNAKSSYIARTSGTGVIDGSCSGIAFDANGGTCSDTPSQTGSYTYTGYACSGADQATGCVPSTAQPVTVTNGNCSSNCVKLNGSLTPPTISGSVSAGSSYAQDFIASGTSNTLGNVSLSFTCKPADIAQPTQTVSSGTSVTFSCSYPVGTYNASLVVSQSGATPYRTSSSIVITPKQSEPTFVTSISTYFCSGD